jgi:hypothetical protein
MIWLHYRIFCALKFAPAGIIRKWRRFQGVDGVTDCRAVALLFTITPAGQSRGIVMQWPLGWSPLGSITLATGGASGNPGHLRCRFGSRDGGREPCRQRQLRGRGAGDAKHRSNGEHGDGPESRSDDGERRCWHGVELHSPNLACYGYGCVLQPARCSVLCEHRRCRQCQLQLNRVCGGQSGGGGVSQQTCVQVPVQFSAMDCRRAVSTQLLRCMLGYCFHNGNPC